MVTKTSFIILFRIFLWYYNMLLSPKAVLHSAERVPVKIRSLNNHVKAIVQSTSALVTSFRFLNKKLRYNKNVLYH